jgi:hypothetical protein
VPAGLPGCRAAGLPGCLPLSRPGRGHSDDRFKPSHAVETNNGAGMGGVDHQPITHVHADMTDIVCPGSEEHQVAGLDCGTRRYGWTRVVLVLGHPGEKNPALPVHILNHARAVEAALGGLTAPLVRSTKQGDGIAHGRSLSRRLPGRHASDGPTSNEITTNIGVVLTEVRISGL